jgi:signal transduction histidine kinase
MMKQNCYRLLRLINNLIDITRIDSGFMKINLTRRNLISIIEDITLSVASYAESKGIEVVFDTETEEKIVSCDPDKIERIMLNLISNSIKFTPKGGSIDVNVYDGEESILISVKDTGIGIPKDKLDVIFERFRQVDSSLQRPYEGSGIGLSLVKALVEAHGGSISVRSTLGEGTEFLVEFPVKALEDEETIDMEEYKKQTMARVEIINIEFSDIYD